MKWFVLAIATIMIGGAYIINPPIDDALNSPQVLGASSSTGSPNNVLSEINAYRVKNGLEPLQFSPEIKTLADYRISDMVSNQYYAHKSPKSLLTYADIINKYVENSTVSCENLQLQNNLQTEEAIVAWSYSQSHKNCLLNPKITKAALSSTYYDEISDTEDNLTATYIFVFIGTN